MKKVKAGFNMTADVLYDKEGFLKDLTQWDENVANHIAKNEKIVLTAEHWELINLARQYHQQYEKSPEMRPFIKYIKQKLEEHKANSLYLLKLFPDSPAKRISKIAGLPKPDNCL